MNFTFPALEAAQNALNHLREIVTGWGEPKGAVLASEQRFLDALNNDLNTPEALAVVWDLVKMDQPKAAKLQSLLKMDQVLGLGLQDTLLERKNERPIDLPSDIASLVRERNELRKAKHYVQADQVRNKLKKLGYELIDADGKTTVKKTS